MQWMMFPSVSGKVRSWHWWRDRLRKIHDSQNACRNLPAYRWEIFYQGARVPDKKDPFGMRKKMQTEIQMIFQDSGAALNPRMSIRQIMLEPVRSVAGSVTEKCWRTGFGKS